MAPLFDGERSMPRNDSEIRSLAEAWIEHELRSCETVSEATFWAWQELDGLVQCEPEEAWKVIEAIRGVNGSDLILANLAAGPVEDLLAKHGTQFIDRMETLARGDRQFRKLLGAVWPSGIPEQVWSRIKGIAGPSF